MTKFVNGDRVKFHSTSDDELDSLVGTVTGLVSQFPETAFYVITLDQRYSKWPWDCITIPEGCISPI